MSQELANESLIADIADEYTQRAERGEKLDVEEYAARYPEIAGVLRNILPALQTMRRVPANSVPPSVVPAVAVTTEVTGCLGDYRILREVGRGGMGVVYEAEQISLGRRVALKVLPFASAMDARQLQRFKNEAQAAAQLHHANIVPVHAVGCERGVYYYAMQFIDGQSLAGVLQDLRLVAENNSTSEQSPAAPVSQVVQNMMAGQAERPNAMQNSQITEVYRAESPSKATLPRAASGTAISDQSIKHPDYFRTIATMMAQAADALQHAHDQGVIHRDIKPANLLVDLRGNLWITDFGLARVQNDAGLTRTGDLMGTFRYMSPEQAMGHWPMVDHRTDIYSLGATLYELLTLRPVFEGRDRQELLRQISVDEPLAPQHLNTAVPKDLQVIVLKALSKAREDRYSTAGELANDLRLHLEHKPILAKPPTIVERASKWARRHRGVMRAAAAAIFLAIAGLTTSTILIAHEKERTQDALVQLQLTNARLKETLASEARLREIAQKDFEQSRDLVDFFVQVTEDELKDKPGLKELRRKLLERALNYYTKLVERWPDSPEGNPRLEDLRRVASLHEAVGNKLAAKDACAVTLRYCLIASLAEPTMDSKVAGWNFAVSDSKGDERFLLFNDGVQKELNFTPEQRKYYFRSVANHVEKVRECKAECNETRLKQFSEYEQALQFVIGQTLTAPQAVRLHQIKIQSMGVNAFFVPEVAKELELKPEQCEKINNIRGECFLEIMDCKDEAKLSLTYHALSSKNQDKVITVLTPDQITKWEVMRGVPLKLEGLEKPKTTGPIPPAPLVPQVQSNTRIK